MLRYFVRKISWKKSNQYKVNYNSQKFPGLFVKFKGKQLTGTLLVFKSGKINYFGIKRPNQFLELDNWIESTINNVWTWGTAKQWRICLY